MPSRRIIAVVLGLLGGFVFTMVAAWQLDVRAHRGEVLRNVSLAGVSVAGQNDAALAKTVAKLADRYALAKVTVNSTGPKSSFSTTGSAIGLEIDARATVKEAMAGGRAGSAPGRFIGWLRSFIAARPAPVIVDVDETSVFAAIAEKDRGPKKAVAEPTLVLAGGKFVAKPGQAGRGIDGKEVAAALEREARRGVPIEVTVARGDVEPRYTLDEIKGLAEEANELTGEPLPVEAGAAKGTVPAATLRTWVKALPGEDGLELAVDGAKAAKDLAALLPAAGTRAVETTFKVNGSEVVVVPGAVGTSCCEEEKTAGLVTAALRDRSLAPVKLPLKEIKPRFTAAEVAKLGIKEVVGTFRTNHPAGQPRVTNIHRIADLIRGQVIEPGGTFSINTFVGRRTTAKGFVSAPVIEDGKFTEDVGGGISQFATTLFNAAFFAGLEFREYQSHSIYISRYPYGREATLAYPHPDLVIKNPTPYGVLIWPSYTASSISVALYSTKFYEVTTGEPTKSPQGVCTRVRTERTRTPVGGGAAKKDSIAAVYRPGEGINCDGSGTPPSSTTTAKPAATTTAKPATTTTAKPPESTSTSGG